MTDNSFTKAHVKIIKYAVRKGKENFEALTQQKFDLASIRMVVFCDSSFENNADSLIQLCFVILLNDKSRRANRLQYSSYKRKRIVRSVLGGETYEFEDGFDFAYTIPFEIEQISGQRLPITMLTDSESRFKFIFKSS